MKVNILDAHDRLIDFRRQSDYISQGCQNCIKNRPEEFGNIPFYIFAHKREIGMDERIAIFNQDIQEKLNNSNYHRKYACLQDIPTHRLLWMPRLTKPTSQLNSMLFKYYPSTDVIKIIWIIPEKHLWAQYVKGNLADDKLVCQSIYEFKNNPDKLNAPESDDISEDMAKQIYTLISANGSNKKLMERLYGK